jgi:hypothetical protein
MGPENGNSGTPGLMSRAFAGTGFEDGPNRFGKDEMMKFIVIILFRAILTISVSTVSAGTTNAPSDEAFGKLKAMVGHWEQQNTGAEEKGTLDIELTAGGSAILERSSEIVNGKPVQMTTIYYLDGDHVQLTHYCMAGNQPTMRGSYSPETKTLTFDFVAASGMKTLDDGHMHHAVYLFLDNDHMKQTWTFRKNQKDTFSEEMTYIRK